jgi:hypothetical protein
MGILERLPAIVNGALGSLVFKDAVLKVPGAATSDGQGGFTNAAPTERACKALVDDYSDARRQALGIPANDRKIIILGASIAAGAVPAVGHVVTIENRDWSVVAVMRDPAGATYEVQGR